MTEMPPAILIVDDEPDVRKVVRSVLEADGYQVAEAADGPAALAGFLPGDIITRIGDHAIDDAQTAFEVIAGMRPGSVVHIEGLRMGAPIGYETAVGARPDYRLR